MTTILVVDDSLIDRHLAGAVIKEREGWMPVYVHDGREALAAIQRDPPDLVLTDLQMPEMNGLELVVAIRTTYPAIPVILMTAHGSEEIAMEALQKGAASFVPKKNLARELIPIIEALLPARTITPDQHLVKQCLISTDFTYVLTNDTRAIQPLINALQEQMTRRNLFDENDKIRVGTALYEVIVNAIEHGNLELNSEWRELQDGGAYRKLAEERRRQSPYKDRTVCIVARFSPSAVSFSVRDEGPGYDPAKLPDPTDPANMEKASGRGLLLIRTFMDDVRLNDKGNEIMLVKRKTESLNRQSSEESRLS